MKVSETWQLLCVCYFPNSHRKKVPFCAEGIGSGVQPQPGGCGKGLVAVNCGCLAVDRGRRRGRHGCRAHRSADHAFLRPLPESPWTCLSSYFLSVFIFISDPNPCNNWVGGAKDYVLDFYQTS